MHRFLPAAALSLVAVLLGSVNVSVAAGNTGAAQHLYVCTVAGSTPEVLVFGPHAHGNVAPERILAGPHTGLSFPWYCAVDAQGHLYVPFSNLSSGPASVLIFRPGAHGDEAPVRRIAGRNTTFVGPHGLGFDAAGNLYVADDAKTIDVFAPGAHGNVAPISAITGLCGASRCYPPTALAVDASGNVSVQIWFVVNSATQVQVLEFAAGSHGNVPPIARIVLNNASTTVSVLSISGSSLYAPVKYSSPPAGEVQMYSVPSLQPLGTLQFGAFRNISSAAADAAGNIYVLCSRGSTSAIFVFPPGSANPSRVIKGNLTGLPGGGYVTLGP